MMTGQRGMLKRTYDALALLALLNMLGVVGVIGALAGTGALTKDKAQLIIEILRGAESPTAKNSTPTTNEATTSTANAGRTATTKSPKSPALSETDMEVVHREAERIKTEIDQRLALVNSIMLKVRTERETFRKERESAAEGERKVQAKQYDEGFRKEVEILESLSSKMALQHLLGLNDPVQAARMLMAMDTDRAKKIVESAKRGEDLTKMKEILQRLPEVGSSGADDLRAEASGEAP